MALYSYQGFDHSGAGTAGTIDAGSEKIAFDVLKSRGITVVLLSPGATDEGQEVAWYKRDIRFFRKELPYQEQAMVADLLATLFQAGLSSAEVVEITAASVEQKEVQRHFERVRQLIVDGDSFPDAFEAESDLFSPVFVSFLRISDAANAMPTLMKELSTFFQKQNATKQKVVSALIYPSILVCSGIGLFLVFALYLAPNLAPIFLSVGREAPATIAFLLGINELLNNYWLILLIAVPSLVLLCLCLLQVKDVQLALSRIRFRLPIVGSLLRLSLLSQLVQSIELLLRSGMSLENALRTSAITIGRGSELNDRFSAAADLVHAGLPASKAFEEDEFLAPSFKELFRIGERTNTLPTTLVALTDQLSSELDRKTQRLLSLITPLLTLLLGIGVGLLIYSIMGAILEINEVVL